MWTPSKQRHALERVKQHEYPKCEVLYYTGFWQPGRDEITRKNLNVLDRCNTAATNVSSRIYYTHLTIGDSMSAYYLT